MESHPHHRSLEELDMGIALIQQAPTHQGTVAMIVYRPQRDERVMIEEGQLTVEHGLVGDNWKARGNSHTVDGSAHPDMQLTIMNVRAIAQIEPNRERWPLAGDQLFVDMDLSANNLPTGTRLVVGDAVLEITAEPHNGCRKFAERFGKDALRWVNAPATRHLNLRGIYAKVIRSGSICTGSLITKDAPHP